ncbi:MAG: OmpH family outer membrane protein [Deltaproteobacteria bacterium]|nr:MAG: OmpH family outer membrane protein [Deltaproteobacteria bacterium]
MLRHIFLLLTLLCATVAEAGTIAVVDFERAVNETEEGKAAQSQLESMYASRKTELDGMRVELEKEYTDYQQRAAVMSDEARKEVEAGIVAKQERFQQLYMQYEQEMQTTYYQLLADLDTKMRALTETIAKEKSYDLVVDKAAVVFAGGATVDMTDDLIRRYNSK